MSRQYFATDPLYPFADAVLIDGKTLYTSGRIGLVKGTRTVPESVEEEAHLVMQDLGHVLGLAGMTLQHVVSLQVFASDVALWERFNAVYRTYFTGQLPPRAFIGSGTLLFGARFELQAIAVTDAGPLKTT
ncbi:MAG TPA: RidA family protein [Acidisarcina sp.]